jgi:taurine dioxygenase
MKQVDPTKITYEQAGIRVTQLGVNLGAEISQVDLRRPLPEEQLAALCSALVEHEVIVFRRQKISSDDLLRLGRQFGPLSVHPFAPSEGNAPELNSFKNDASTPPFATDTWHSDETFRAEPPMATILCAKQVPTVGGDTMFASMTAAYDGLSTRSRALIDGLSAVHDIKPFRPLFGESEAGREQLHAFERKFPPQLHPVVRIHPESGRRLLFVNANFTIRIKDMDERDSHSLLEMLFQQAAVPEYQFRLHWEPDTVTIWDNRSAQHYAVHDYYPQRRYMERVTIRGGPVEGLTGATADEVRRIKFQAAPGADVYGGHKPH